MPGNHRSGRKALGAALLADGLDDHLRQGADLFRALCPGGVGADVAAWIEASGVMLRQAEIDAAKTALARSLLEDDDVTDAALRLALDTYERFGPLIRLVDRL
jgi:hypothetical protein